MNRVCKKHRKTCGNALYAEKRICHTSHTTQTENEAYKGIYALKSTLIHTLFKPPTDGYGTIRYTPTTETR